MTVDEKRPAECEPAPAGTATRTARAAAMQTMGLPLANAGNTEPAETDPIAADHLGETDLHIALADAWIHTLYQPIVRMADRRPIGVEVLARLDHPSRGMLQPGLFVPSMEDAGLSWSLTQAVMRRAFADWGSGQFGQMDLTLALNLPLDVLLTPDALTRLDAARNDAGIPAERVVIELTESRPLACLHRLGEAARRLRAIGYGLAIDDVGPAIRDHSALLGLSFTSMKLDKDLVQRAAADPAATRFLTSAVAAAHEAGLSVTAEGVEDAATWAYMELLGVEHVQGFLVSRPLAAEEVAAWRQAWCGGQCC
ncbi:EAL domain-containing protein [Limobrevibacterium gyesilva]|uniref:EAL domain-containing protein n=1 Tax=Limobrevibacterium gyesilva TaxID=2991712 RepID=A0AA42CCT5_9PROT|nr:EAL domain-containing protein [Limobrevibacterium gyesilva]MCW3473943.1 EAL domain-containing protein [Limobrevibacterium gyesilva]